MRLLFWAKKHLVGLCVSFVVFCSLLWLWAGVAMSMAEDAPGAIIIFSGIAFIGSGIVGLIWGVIGKLLIDIEKKLK